MGEPAEICRLFYHSILPVEIIQPWKDSRDVYKRQAYLCAQYCMNVIDCGVPVLSMHAPWEVISKVDLYEAYKCYCACLKA